MLSEREGFIVAYPDGIERRWNDGRGQQRYRAHRENIDDVGFILKLIDRLSEQFSIDRKRVYVTGISNGGLMSNRLANERADKIAAIAVVTASITTELASRFSPPQPIPVLIINGEADPLVPYEGGEIHFGKLALGTVTSTAETVRLWLKHNGCPAKPVVTSLPDVDPGDGTRVRREVYGSAESDAEVILYCIENGGHTWPGGQQYLPESRIGKTCRDINACVVIWNFFKSHSLK